MAWPVGTNTPEHLKQTLETFLEGRLADAQYSSRVPAGNRVQIGVPKDNRRGGNPMVQVNIYTGADEEPPHEYQTDAGRVQEEYHRITLDCVAGSRNSDAAQVNRVVSTLRAIFGSPAERAALGTLGIYNVRESAEGVEMDEVEFSRPVNLTCTTDVNL